MFVYINYRKHSGIIGQGAFYKANKLSSFVIGELGALVRDIGNNGDKLCAELKTASSNNIESLPQLRELIKKFEKWAPPTYEPAIMHDVMECDMVNGLVPHE